MKLMLLSIASIALGYAIRFLLQLDLTLNPSLIFLIGGLAFFNGLGVFQRGSISTGLSFYSSNLPGEDVKKHAIKDKRYLGEGMTFFFKGPIVRFSGLMLMILGAMIFAFGVSF